MATTALGTSITLPVDFTSRDYTSIRADLINAIPTYLPEWTDSSISDFGIALLELFAYMGDVLNYYVDRMANEAFLPTAQQRQSVLNLAYLIDYAPTEISASVADLTITMRAGAASLIIPSGTQFATQATITTASIVFETGQDYTLPDNSASTTTLAVTTVEEDGVMVPIQVTQGQTISAEAVGTSNGLPAQIFTLLNIGVIGGSITVSVNEGNGFQIWAEVPNLAQAGPADAVWSETVDANGVVYINFGDGANGRIPANAAGIQATYRIGGGAASNVPANTIVNCLDPSLVGIYAVTNPVAASGGADAETIPQIQANAPQGLTALYRCVSLADYAAVALQYPGVGKASATSMVSTSVQLYIHPSGGPYDSATLQSMVMDANVGLGPKLTNPDGTGWLDDRKPGGVTVTILPPNYDGTVGYVPVIVTAIVQVLPTYDHSQVQQNVIAALVTLLNFGSVSFGELITQSSIWHAIQEAPGVDYLSLIELRRGDATAGTLGNVQCQSFEIPLLQPTNINITTNGGL